MCRQIALYVDRNYQRRTHIARHLVSLGLELHKASTIRRAEELVKRHPYKLALIHFDTAGEKIFDFCSFLRAGSEHTVLIVLMANHISSVEEKLFDCGANDVVVGKQLASRVLVKRIRAHLNRSKLSEPDGQTVRLLDTVIDFNRQEVWCNGTIRRIRGILAELLKYFLENPGVVISRDELLKSPIWADSICSSARDGGKTFDVHIGKLRRIIESDPTSPKIIMSVRGEGWKLAADIVTEFHGEDTTNGAQCTELSGNEKPSVQTE